MINFSPIRLIAWVIEATEAPNKRKFVVVNIAVSADVMNESVNAISNDTIADKIAQSVERSDIDFVEWNVIIANDFGNLVG